MPEQDFESKRHVTKHLTLDRYGQTKEATRVNSWQEQDYLSWKLFLAANLTPENVTPRSLKTICDASEKYRKAYGSYSFGLPRGVKPKWIIIGMVIVSVLMLMLYMTGNLEVGR